MGVRSINFVEGEYYHIYNRGNSKQKIFINKEDYLRFIKLLFLCNSTSRVNFKEDIVEKKIDSWEFKRGNQIVSIGAWVLMPNHFHVLIKIPKNPQSKALGKSSRNGVTEFMLKLGTAYSKYFNKKYSRTGSLFEGKFKSVHIGDDRQLKYIFSYIHLNPIKLIDKNWKDNGIGDKNGALKYLSTYKWSSYLDYLEDARIERLILDKLEFPDYFAEKDRFVNEIFSWLNFSQSLALGEDK